MKRLKVRSFLFVILIFLMSSCSNAVPENSSDPAILNGETESDLASEASDTVQDAAEYVLTEPIVVDNGRKLTLKLHGKKLSEEDERYGINTIDVYEGDKFIQTISIHNAILAEWDGTDDFGGYTDAFTQDGGFTSQDMNFDGSGDIGLIGWTTSGANIPYYYWLWNKEKQQFEYAFSLSNAEVDSQNKQLITRTRDGATQYDINYYKYDENGKLQNVKRIVKIREEDGKTITEIYELVDGRLEKIN
ncbi:XAC2610-related protein [Sinanaerobacter sp. ZZT-01]|uniref:XAC2610-related protein n=1 Tax=Sinanaerobacter sp. ZZT-01 TaxID=3111540 RepID=UPI002D774A77|nr:hypothetical protein [Sinanaerobacter sp. ZZT-01]WRR93257.1 hypothetical protein U5921_14675 [Sinanaerobacter sp. ZZT-01]